jgi:NAD(P)-dependent dehydrogenase (short-subunit alcohol dehydrogenase family)
MQSAVAANPRTQPVTRFEWSPAEAGPLPDLPNPRLAGRRILIAGASSQAAADIAQALIAQGAFPVVYADDADFATGPIDGIIDLNAENRDWETALVRSLRLLRSCYEEWVREADAERLFYMPITRMGGTMGYGKDEPAHPLGGIWAGLAKTLPREIPNCNVRVLDLAEPDFRNAGDLVARELYRWGLFEIGYRNGKRYCLSAHSQEVSPPAVTLSASDTVLLSGGARGIGFALAKKLARSHGCRVIITGRTAMPDCNEPWLQMTEPEFKGYLHKLMKDASTAGNLARVRTEIDRIKTRRELFQNLTSVSVDRLPIEYHACDITSREAVGALIRQIGPGLSVVIHNAGVDAPVRLPSKSDASFLSTVRTKVEGFFNLFEAVRQKQLKIFCSVGSLTGRWGGMIGEIDYAAANEGLSRLGMWAAARAPFPVKTICWPTWERLGMIKNFDTAVAYSSALGVEEGTRKWEQELASASSGEVMFMGALGNAGSPLYLKGFPPIPDAISIEELYTQFHYLCDVVRFRPFQELTSRNRIEIPAAPLMQEFRVQGVAALPVSILLDYAIAAGDWVQPEGHRGLRLLELRGVRVNLRGLKARGTAYEFRREARGQWVDGTWTVEVKLQSNQESTGFRARLTLVYGKSESAASFALPASAKEIKPRREDSGELVWTGIHMKIVRFRQNADGSFAGEVATCPVADLWSTAYVPRGFLPHTALENIFRTAACWNEGVECAELTIARLQLTENQAGAVVVVRGNEHFWTIHNRSGQPVARIEGLAYAASEEK